MEKSIKERPILFNGPMVRALLGGSKTQTRRVSGLEVINAEPDRYEFRGIASGPGVPHLAFHDRKSGAQVLVRCRHGQPGDRIWVRETWARTVVAQCAGQEWVVYREGDNRTDYGGPWKPGIHMFRKDSRITLEVVGVRVERLQDISAADAGAEGVRHFDRIPVGPITAGLKYHKPDRWSAGAPENTDHCVGTARNAYGALWEQINGPGSWDANPWVWVVEFRRLK